MLIGAHTSTFASRKTCTSHTKDTRNGVPIFQLHIESYAFICQVFMHKYKQFQSPGNFLCCTGGHRQKSVCLNYLLYESVWSGTPPGHRLHHCGKPPAQWWMKLLRDEKISRKYAKWQVNLKKSSHTVLNVGGDCWWGHNNITVISIYTWTFQKGAKLFCYRVSTHRGSKWHPLGAGRLVYI